MQGELRVLIHNLLKKNKDFFARNDKDFGRIDTVKMCINTNRHVPLKKHTYHTPLTHTKKT